MSLGLAYLGADVDPNNPNNYDENGMLKSAASGGGPSNWTGVNQALQPLVGGLNTWLSYDLQRQKLKTDATALANQQRLMAQNPNYVPYPYQAGMSAGTMVGIAAAGLGVIGLVLLLKRKRG